MTTLFFTENNANIHQQKNDSMWNTMRYLALLLLWATTWMIITDIMCEKARQTHIKYILYNSISMKFKTGKTKSTVVMQNSGYLQGAEY